jgi:hypothetical protein
MEERIMSISDALMSLRPGAQWVAVDGVVTWHDTEQTQPSDAEVQSEVTRLQEEYDAQDYARNRKAEYDMLNQFEMIGEDSINGTTTHKDAILAIKAKYPKS